MGERGVCLPHVNHFGFFSAVTVTAAATATDYNSPDVFSKLYKRLVLLTRWDVNINDVILGLA